MTVSRSQQIDLESTPYYHCMSRCVRRAYLCGEDRVRGESYEHRKGWIEWRMKYLSGIYGIQICAYAVMSNHYHMVLFVDKVRVLGWSEEEVLGRWRRMYPGDGKKIDLISKAGGDITERISVIRERLSSISWFMRGMNEWIARESNREDGCEGRFWEKRFKSQALLDEGAILSAMAYVDLNPIRAGEAQTPELSDYTSIQERIEGLNDSQPEGLMPFQEEGREGAQISFKLSDYLTLVDQTGRSIRGDKKGYIASDLEPLLERLQLQPKGWLQLIQSFEKEFAYVVGSQASIRSFSQKQARRAPKGFTFSKTMYQKVS